MRAGCIEMQDRDLVRKTNLKREPEHMSHFKLTQQALACSGGRMLNPLEITQQEEAACRLQKQQKLHDEQVHVPAVQQALQQQVAAQEAAAVAAAAAMLHMHGQAGLGDGGVAPMIP